MIERIDLETRIEYRLKSTIHTLYRPNGPAIIWRNGEWGWFLFDNWHRYYGPARRYGDWWIHGCKMK